MNTVKFKEDTHQYFSGNIEYISATTVIKKYSTPFDSKYWSTYKAIKDVLGKLNLWEAYKKQAGGWENVVAYWSDTPVEIDAILDRKQYYLKAWEAEGHAAREKGTLAHAIKEAEIKGHLVTKGQSVGETLELPLGINEEGIMGRDYESSGIFAEVLVWNDEFKVAGQVDKVIKRGKAIDIEDYKTNKKLVWDGFRGAKMKFPLDDYPDCNMSHYQIQLSLYAWMLEQQGYKIGNLTVIHIPDSKTEKRIEVEYKGFDVELMLKHYAQQRIFD